MEADLPPVLKKPLSSEQCGFSEVTGVMVYKQQSLAQATQWSHKNQEFPHKQNNNIHSLLSGNQTSWEAAAAFITFRRLVFISWDRDAGGADVSSAAARHRQQQHVNEKDWCQSFQQKKKKQQHNFTLWASNSQESWLITANKNQALGLRKWKRTDIAKEEPGFHVTWKTCNINDQFSSNKTSKMKRK